MLLLIDVVVNNNLLFIFVGEEYFFIQENFDYSIS